MLEKLKENVCEANLELVSKGVVIYTWGNVSGLDRESGLVVIKPSGLDYAVMRPEDMVVVDVNTAKVVEGKWKPSSDLKTHLEIYRSFPEIGGITHTHSVFAVSFAQAGIDVPALGTTHADLYDDCFDREITKHWKRKVLHMAYTSFETMRQIKSDPKLVPGILVRNHGPFAFGKDAKQSVYHAVVMEEVCKMAIFTKMLNPQAQMPQYIMDKHFMRKHGANAYYGQKSE